MSDYGQDVILNAGKDIADYPNGTASGVKAFFEALEYVKKGESLNLDSLPDGALKSAIQK